MTNEANGEADALIEGYKRVLTSEAELARGDLDEIEDHLRALTEELRASGMPRVAAVREACRRLGDPRAVAREHARVRSPFGARLSRMRAYSAVALILPMLAGNFMLLPRFGVLSPLGIETALGVIVTIAVALRLTWARPIVLGATASIAVQLAIALATMPGPQPIYLVLHLGIIAFVLPWRRSELTAAGAALALQVWAFGVATFALQLVVSTHHGFVIASLPGALIAYFATIAATAGGVLRARWGALASLISAAALGLAFANIVPLRLLFWEPVQPAILLVLASGSVASLVGAVVAWRSARSNIGTFAHVLA